MESHGLNASGEMGFAALQLQAKLIQALSSHEVGQVGKEWMEARFKGQVCWLDKDMAKDEVVDQLACLGCQSLAGPCPWDGGPLNNQPHIHVKNSIQYIYWVPIPFKTAKGRHPKRPSPFSL